jgi:hypothetical protein
MAADGGGPPSPEGGSAYRGAILFHEAFQDGDFASRGWYDEARGAISTDAPLGSTSSFECRFTSAASSCEQGRPGRILFAESEAVYLSYWIKYGADYRYSDLPVFITNEDPAVIGTMLTHLSIIQGQSGGAFHVAVYDNENVDTHCVLFNDGTFSGCNGDPATYTFSEARSLGACNGAESAPDEASCDPSPYPSTGYASSRTWLSASAVLGQDGGPQDQSSWHFIELFYAMNSIGGGIGLADGQMRVWVDRADVITVDRVRLRTGQHPNMRFNQLALTPYAQPYIDQTMWISDLTLAVGVRH